ncbi:YceI family protein [Sediminitomix flava]|uniref:YceI-like domain-containing protein n=1 Tax=Sediminitomix flava TaxID=379075 RepID=A0A315Z820_SEDFL|nr:YceI family protein [Sediminitomix flava]PWJ41071.1 YceI-like domain-containing protein [Sediminitomix flava]
MKKLLRTALIGLISVSVFTACQQKAEEKKEESTEETTVETPAAEESTEEVRDGIVWTGSKVTGSHTGTVEFKESALKFEGEKLVGGSFVVDMTSLVDTDLDGEYKQKLEGHLKSDDFFSVEKHPTSKFMITSVKDGAAANEYEVSGDLTIKGITKPVTFPAKVEIKDKEAVATANVVVDRTLYDIKYGSNSFFDNLGDKAIDNDFKLEVRLSTVMQ